MRVNSTSRVLHIAPELQPLHAAMCACLMAADQFRGSLESNLTLPERPLQDWIALRDAIRKVDGLITVKLRSLYPQPILTIGRWSGLSYHEAARDCVMQMLGIAWDSGEPTDLRRERVDILARIYKPDEAKLFANRAIIASALEYAGFTRDTFNMFRQAITDEAIRASRDYEPLPNAEGGSATKEEEESPPVPRCVVELFGADKRPKVFGKEVKVLTPAKYVVVEALVNAGATGMSKSELEAVKGDAVKYLRQLRGMKTCPAWKRAIAMPGSAWKGYRIKHE